jgi:hypothetical protein
MDVAADDGPERAAQLDEFRSRVRARLAEHGALLGDAGGSTGDVTGEAFKAITDL